MGTKERLKELAKTINESLAEIKAIEFDLENGNESGLVYLSNETVNTIVRYWYIFRCVEVFENSKGLEVDEILDIHK